MKNAQTGLKSSHPLDRADYLQTGMNPEQDECEHKYISDRSQLRSLLWNNAWSTNRCKNNNMAGRGINEKICDFHTGLTWAGPSLV